MAKMDNAETESESDLLSSKFSSTKNLSWCF